MDTSSWKPQRFVGLRAPYAKSAAMSALMEEIKAPPGKPARRGRPADASPQGGWRSAALRWAAKRGKLWLAKGLVKAGCEVDARDAKGLGALMWAVGFPGAEGLAMAVYLAAHGADVGADCAGWTPMMRAAVIGSDGMCAALAELGASVSTRDAEGMDCLMLAARTGRAAAVAELLAAGADAKRVDKSGRSALAWAAAGGHIACLEALEPAVDLATVERPDAGGVRPADLAKKAFSEECARWLAGYAGRRTRERRLAPVDAGAVAGFGGASM